MTLNRLEFVCLNSSLQPVFQIVFADCFPGKPCLASVSSTQNPSVQRLTYLVRATSLPALNVAPDSQWLGFYDVSIVLNDAELMDIGVVVKARGQGVGQALLSHAIDHCRRAGCQRMFLEVEDTNGAAIHLYQRAGFQQTGFRPHYYGRDRHAILMSLGFPGL